MKHRADWAMLSFGILLVSLSCTRLMMTVTEPPWVDWLILVIGALLVTASIIRLLNKGG